MPAAISVTDQDIEYAERVLLPEGASFDEERRRYIREFRTLDLQAVPGSGKTTALLAKLLILDRYLPFPDGAGVLVISHTNAAMDEIKARIGTHCGHLFSYPNFVGTIQSFVDTFLAIPYFEDRYKRSPHRIDDEAYDAKFSRPPVAMSGFTRQETNNARSFLFANRRAIRITLVEGRAELTDGYCGKKTDFKKPRAKTDWTPQEKDRVGQWVMQFKQCILEDGFLCFDDAYYLASSFLAERPAIRNILQKRFPFVFVDEMQDMEGHQYGLLEDLFFDSGRSSAAYQRIGDKNQSIFERRGGGTSRNWEDRGTVLELNGSYRLNGIVAGIVERFAVSPIRIEGRMKRPDGCDIGIKPRILVFSDESKDRVIATFGEAIAELIAQGRIVPSPANRFKAVAWATQKEDGKLRLCDYFPTYEKPQPKSRVDFPSLDSCVRRCDRSSQSFHSIENAITGALLRILREEGAKDERGIPYSKRRMADFLRESKEDYWPEFRRKLYEWCLSIARDELALALHSIREHLPAFLSRFGCIVKNSATFVNGAAEDDAGEQSANAPCGEANRLKFDDFAVDVSTVHRVKGETHTATLYMESFYEKGGGGNYESERLAKQLKGEALDAHAHQLVKQSAKMAYVGFSRPTHLLCFALHESRFATLEADIDPNVWDIVRVLPGGRESDHAAMAA